MHTVSAIRFAQFAGDRPLWQVSALAGVGAAVATELFGLAARAAGVPMSAAGLGAATAQPITVGMFAMGTLICTFWGTVLAVVLGRYARRPVVAYVGATVGLTVVSLVIPLTAGHTATSTKLTLALGHLVAAAIIIPTVAHRLSLPLVRPAGPGRPGGAR
ncbi:DUF6069 family protein [Streptomyces spiralis]|uniref:Uncharacterized protein n=1 Tax=Streptomyces spiralis TaxID=66376 RepID=A0A919ALT7_9ACTN|nr:DUF6069 family protein [Streptomyces spiralis]GHF13981.1 hypothetical protein GCM10014715_81840 [Streptomyces spiralis]